MIVGSGGLPNAGGPITLPRHDCGKHQKPENYIPPGGVRPEGLSLVSQQCRDTSDDMF